MYMYTCAHIHIILYKYMSCADNFDLSNSTCQVELECVLHYFSSVFALGLSAPKCVLLTKMSIALYNVYCSFKCVLLTKMCTAH